MQLRLGVRNASRWEKLLRLLQALSGPSIKDLRHELHPLGRSPCEVVFDGLISKRNEVVMFVVR